MSLAPSIHPPVEWLTLRQTSELSDPLSLIVDCHRSVCAACDKQATGNASASVLNEPTPATGLPRVLGRWLDSTERTKWTLVADGIECIDLTREDGLSVWLERRAPTGPVGGWAGGYGCIGLMLAGAVCVDGRRLSRGDVLSECTENSVVRVVPKTSAVFLRGCVHTHPDGRSEDCPSAIRARSRG